MPSYSVLSQLRQSFFLPKAPLTEANIGDLSGKTVLITGGNSGVGFELCSILYGANAKVFLAGRNETACADAISAIRSRHPSSTGSLEWLKLDLSDLATVAASAKTFLSKADRLDYLANNAGVMIPPAGSKGKQGHELQQATNVLGAYIFTELLRPILVKTAQAEKAKGNENVVRVSWAGSSGIDIVSPPHGVTLVKDAQGLDDVKVEDAPMTNYGVTKAGNLYLAKLWGDEVKNDGIVSTCFNPGNLYTGLQRHSRGNVPNWLFDFLATKFLHPQRFGAYTELYCGFSPDLTTADNGAYIAPWGRKWFNRPDIEDAKNGEIAVRYVDWIRRETKPYMNLGTQEIEGTATPAAISAPPNAAAAAQADASADGSASSGGQLFA